MKEPLQQTSNVNKKEMSDKESCLEIHRVSTRDDIQVYKDFLNAIDAHSPYYKIELLNVNLKNFTKLIYFIYRVDNEPIVLMPVYLREILVGGKRTPYFDITSPWGYTGPLVKKGRDTKILTSFWEKVDEWYNNNNIVTEFVRFNFNNNHLAYTGIVTHTLSNIRGKIETEGVLWDNFNRSVRKNVNTARKNELRYEMYFKDIPHSKIEEFYAIYIGTMNRHEASETFYHSLEYFAKFIAENKENCSLATIYKDNLAISTELLLLSEDTMYSFLGGTDAAYFGLRPNDFLKIETLNWGRNNGFDYYILGGGLADGDGLYQYKKKFFPNDDDVNFYTGRKIVDIDVYRSLVEIAYPEKINFEDHIANIGEGFFPLYRIVK